MRAMPTAGLVLYHGLASTCSKKVRMCLFEKGLDFESHLLDLQKFEQHDPDYLRLNPNGVVPTLVHDGRPIVESSIIIQYLDDAFPDPPLLPADPYARARARLWLKFSDDVAYGAVGIPTWEKISRPVASKLSEKELEAVLARVPTDERRERWRKTATTGFSKEEHAQVAARAQQCFIRIEAALEYGDWLNGSTFSLADIAMIPFIDRLRNLNPELAGSPDWPRLNGWYDRMSARPAFARAFNFQNDPRAAEMVNI
jgi:glutathione S-transferase